MTTAEIAWLAGLLEGEGSFMVHRSTAKGKIYPKPRVQISLDGRTSRVTHR